MPTILGRLLLVGLSLTTIGCLSTSAFAGPDGGVPSTASVVASYAATADRLISAAQGSSLGFERLAHLCTHFPRRLAGTQTLEGALDWCEEAMRADGFDAVTTDPVAVPHWVRGQESLRVLGDEPYDLPMLGLGGSVGTPAQGIEAPVLVVESFEELESKAGLARGRVVVFNQPFTTYGQSGRYRWDGASQAARYGAVAALVRSVTPFSLATVHTGGMEYDDGQPKIPAASITVEAAQTLARRQRAGLEDRVRLTMGAQTLPDAPSRNLIAEIRGWQYPDEIVVLGGHIDSWDVGEGAQDDGAGILTCWEALRLIKALDLKPRRTIRLVLWTNEENGTRGAKAYRALREHAVADHVLAIESDYGTFHPTGFSYGGNDRAKDVLARVLGLLEARVGPMSLTPGGGGADIGPLMREGVPGLGLDHKDERYFWYHHSAADTLDKVDIQDFRNCTAVLAVTAFVVADLPERLPFGLGKDSASY